MTDLSLSIIIPTTGKETLNRAITSATQQMLPGDELFVVFDDTGDWGSTPRNRAVAAATGSYLTFLDHDDVYLPGAFDAMRAFGREHPGRIGIFQRRLGLYGVVWTEPDPTLMNTATGMYVVPNIKGKLGRFGRMPGIETREDFSHLYGFPVGDRAERLGDGRFIIETVALQQEPIWVPILIQDVRPEESALRRLRYRLKARTRLKRAFGIDVPDPVPAMRRYPGAEQWAREKLGLD